MNCKKRRVKHPVLCAMVVVLTSTVLLTSTSCAEKKAVAATGETVEQVAAVQSEDTAAETAGGETIETGESELSTQTVEIDKTAEEEAAKAQEETEQARLADEKEQFLTQHIHFDYDSANLDEQAQSLARQKAAWLAVNPDIEVHIEGYCDQEGSEAYNMALGQRRARAVKAYLKNLGISQDRLIEVSFGEKFPLTETKDKATARINRRVEFKIQPSA